MENMIESLESRMLLSGTTAGTLAADNSLIISDAAAAKAALNALIAVDLANDQTIQAALRGSHTAGSSGVAASIRADEVKAKNALKTDINTLTRTGTALAKKSVKAGDALLAKFSNAKVRVVAVDAAALGKVSLKPLGKIATALASTKITSDLEALRTLNPGNTALSAAIDAREAGQTTQAASVTAAAVKFQSDLNALGTHLASIFTV